MHFVSGILVKVQWLSHLSLWRRQIRAGTGPGTANMKHLLPPQKLWLLKGSIHHWTSVLRFDTIVQILPFSPLSPHFLASDLFPFLSAFFLSVSDGWSPLDGKMQRLQLVRHADCSLHSPKCVLDYKGMFIPPACSFNPDCISCGYTSSLWAPYICLFVCHVVRVCASV